MIVREDFLRKNLHIENEALIREAMQCMRYHRYAKGELMIKRGEPLSEYYFLATDGAVRSVYTTKKGKEITECMVTEAGECMMPSAALGEPSPVDVEALTDVGVISFPCEAVNRLEKEYPEILHMKIAILAECWTMQREIKRVRYEYNTKERYLWFLRTYPRAAGRVMDKHIASLLDMTPVQISRIRRQIEERPGPAKREMI